MRILVVTQYFWPENFKINDFVLGMSELGHSVTVLTGKPNYPSGRFYKGYNFFSRRTDHYNYIKIIRAPLITRGGGGGLRLMMNYFSFAFFASVSGLLRVRNSFDVIFVYEPSPITVGIPAIVLRKKFDIPVFLWVQDLWPESVEIAGNVKNKTVLEMLNKLVIKIYKNTDKILISSRSFFDSIRLKDVESDKIIYFPNWPEDVYTSENPDVLKYLDIMPSGFRIMFAGNIGDSQDFESILMSADLLRQNKKIHWIIIGDGRRKLWLESEVKRLGLSSNFHILGSYPQNDMPNFFHHCDALLVSLKDSKIFSMTVPAKIQSYLAFGKPILAMLNGEGSSIILEAGAGLSCNAGDFKQLAINVEILAGSDEDHLRKMGENARKYSNENFNRALLFKKFEQIYLDFKGEKNNKGFR